VPLTVPTPSSATRIDRVVLRADWTARTVEAALLQGVEGGGAPSLTQTAGVTWEIPLAQLTVTTGGAITVTDQRAYCRYPTLITANNLDAALAGNGLTGGGGFALAVQVDGVTLEIAADALRVKDAGITTDKINALAVTTGKIDNAAVIESKIADGAVTTDKIYALNVVSSKIANGAVGPTKLADAAVETAKIKDDAVTADKLAHSLDAQPIGLNADKVDGYHASEIIASGLFVGMVTPFYGSLGGSDGHRPLVGGSPKEDWHVCNGELVGGVQTPNLQGRTVVGVGGTLGASLGDVGGQITLNLAHYHSDGTLSAASHTHGYVDATGYPVTGLTYWVDATPETGNVFLAIASAHTHSTTNATLGATADVTGNTGTALSASQNIMNPYMALYWIMKVV